MIKNILILLLLLIAGVANAATVTLGWDANTEPDVVGYEVHYGGISRIYTNVSDAGNALTFTITNLVPGATHYFALTAYTTNGTESDYSAELAYIVPAIPNGNMPGQPQNFAPTVITTNSLTFAWSAPTTTNRIIGYRVFWRTATNVAYGPYQVSMTTQHTLTNLTAGTRYFVAVAAVDSSILQSALSAEVSAVTLSTVPVPQPPQGLRIITTTLQGSTDTDGPWQNLASVTNQLSITNPLTFFRAHMKAEVK